MDFISDRRLCGLFLMILDIFQGWGVGVRNMCSNILYVTGLGDVWKENSHEICFK